MNAGAKQGAALVRALSGFPVAAAVLVAVWMPSLSWVFAAFIALLAGLGYREFCALASRKGIAAESGVGMVLAAAVTLSGYGGNVLFTLMVLCLSVLSVTLLQTFRGLTLAGAAASVFGLVYTGWFASYVVLAHRVDGVGAGIVTLLIAVIALSDTGAYALGSALGKHKMAPAISPKKSWEGTAGGLALALTAGAALWLLGEQWGGLFPDWSLARYAATAAGLSVVGQAGDLAESAMKRDAGVKDSGNFLPGHGGVLDRCDSYLFAAPVLYYVASL